MVKPIPLLSPFFLSLPYFRWRQRRRPFWIAISANGVRLRGNGSMGNETRGKTRPPLPPALGFPRTTVINPTHSPPQKASGKNLPLADRKREKEKPRSFSLSLSSRCLLFQMGSISFLPASSQSRKFPPRGTKYINIK